MGAEPANTRGRILSLLCGREQTASELAAALGISRSATRVHLGGLEEAGLVEHERVVHGVGKPAHRYRLTPAGEGFLSRAYLPLLASLLDVLSSRMDDRVVDDLLRAAGRRLADGLPKPDGGPDSLVGAAVELVLRLGGSVEASPAGEAVTLQGRCCPVAAISPGHPAVCAALEELLAAYTGLPVREHCDRADRPRCRFDVSMPPRAAPRGA